ncbi:MULTISPECIES: hypothetical protein [unclassified Flavobacterium]|uniref:hypothetical protein n=2 Tax=Flavobacterium TaxID=237 RepID=UPI0025BFFB3E|nr:MULTISPECIES: hypothetical protein [unclassified Flavobacterium]
MKKNNFYCAMLMLATLLLNSCSSNNETETQSSNTILVKKIIKTYSANDISILTYKYDGNKIISESNDSGFVATYTYTGNVITKIEERVNNNFQNSREYTYVNGKIAIAVEKTNCCGTDTYSYTYNSNGTVSYNRTRTGSQSTTGLLTFVNGNMVKNEEFYGGQYPSTSTYIFGYDTKNNPFKNVLGFNLLLDTNEDTFSMNNLIQDGSGGSGTIDTRTFKYGGNNYPTEVKYSTGETYQYFY